MEALFDLLEESEEGGDEVIRVVAGGNTLPGDVAEGLLNRETLQLPGNEASPLAVPAVSAAARPAAQPVGGLYEKVNAPRLRGRENGGNVVVRMSGPAATNPEGERGPQARELDRIFQRDARRYDGGLSLL